MYLFIIILIMFLASIKYLTIKRQLFIIFTHFFYKIKFLHKEKYLPLYKIQIFYKMYFYSCQSWHVIVMFNTSTNFDNITIFVLYLYTYFTDNILIILFAFNTAKNCIYVCIICMYVFI